MKKLFILLFCLIPTLAFAEPQRNPCFINVNGGCTPVSTADPMPVDSSSGGATGTNFTTSQVSVATTSTATVAARTSRKSVTITNITGTQPVYCSGDTATTANGQYIPAVAGASYTVSTTAAINCIASTSAQTVSVAEVY